MKIRQFEIWAADLNPRNGTEAGKTRPVLVVQTDLLNDVDHPSTLVCPLTTNIKPTVSILRVNLHSGNFGLKKNSSVMIDQVRSIDNKRLVKRVGVLSDEDIVSKIKDNLGIIMDLEI